MVMFVVGLLVGCFVYAVFVWPAAGFLVGVWDFQRSFYAALYMSALYLAASLVLAVVFTEIGVPSSAEFIFAVVGVVLGAPAVKRAYRTDWTTGLLTSFFATGLYYAIMIAVGLGRYLRLDVQSIVP